MRFMTACGIDLLNAPPIRDFLDTMRGIN